MQVECLLLELDTFLIRVQQHWVFWSTGNPFPFRVTCLEIMLATMWNNRFDKIVHYGLLDPCSFSKKCTYLPLLSIVRNHVKLTFRYSNQEIFLTAKRLYMMHQFIAALQFGHRQFSIFQWCMENILSCLNKNSWMHIEALLNLILRQMLQFIFWKSIFSTSQNNFGENKNYDTCSTPL